MLLPGILPRIGYPLKRSCPLKSLFLLKQALVSTLLPLTWIYVSSHGSLGKFHPCGHIFLKLLIPKVSSTSHPSFLCGDRAKDLSITWNLLSTPWGSSTAFSSSPQLLSHPLVLWPSLPLSLLSTEPLFHIQCAQTQSPLDHLGKARTVTRDQFLFF